LYTVSKEKSGDGRGGPEAGVDLPACARGAAAPPAEEQARMDPRPFVSGTAAGVIAGFVGHPLDTIRVRMQTTQGGGGTAAAGSALDCARDLLRKEGPRALFKGLGPQMIGYCAHSAIRFGVFGNANTSAAQRRSAVQKGLSAASSGAKAGIALSPIISVLELLKCRQQVSRQVPQPPLRSVLGQLLRKEGVRGLTCGYTACLPRSESALAAAPSLSNSCLSAKRFSGGLRKT